MISWRHTLPTPVLPLSVVAFLQPLFETEGIVFPHQETESHGKRDFWLIFNTLYCNLLQCRTASAVTKLSRVQMQNAKHLETLNGVYLTQSDCCGSQKVANWTGPGVTSNTFIFLLTIPDNACWDCLRCTFSIHDIHSHAFLYKSSVSFAIGAQPHSADESWWPLTSCLPHHQSLGFFVYLLLRSCCSSSTCDADVHDGGDDAALFLSLQLANKIVFVCAWVRARVCAGVSVCE